MKTVWTKGMDPKQKEALRASFGASADIRERAIVLLREKVETNRKHRRADAAYESPNWAYQQADLCGYERALEEMINLFSS